MWGFWAELLRESSICTAFNLSCDYQVAERLASNKPCPRLSKHGMRYATGTSTLGYVGSLNNAGPLVRKDGFRILTCDSEYVSSEASLSP